MVNNLFKQMEGIYKTKFIQDGEGPKVPSPMSKLVDSIPLSYKTISRHFNLSLT
jgi:hypothetical protein